MGWRRFWGALTPQKGWGAFGREVGVIVLGVLIALVVGEAANAVRLRVEAQRAMEVVRADMIDNSAAFEIRIVTAACARRRLDELTQEIADLRRTGRLRYIGKIGGPPLQTFRAGTWDSAVGNRDVLFVDRHRVAELTDYHELLREYRAIEDVAALDWARLRVLSHAAGPVDGNTLAAVSQTIAELRYRTDRAEHLAHQMLDVHRGLGFPVEYLPFNGQPRTRESALRSIREDLFCRPLQVAEGGA